MNNLIQPQVIVILLWKGKDDDDDEYNYQKYKKFNVVQQLCRNPEYGVVSI